MGVTYRRSWPERAVLALGVALIAGCLYGAWYIADIEETFSGIPRYKFSPGVLAEVGDVRFDARNFLVMGWTDTTGIDPGDDLMYNRDSERLADTIMVVRVDPTAATAAVLSIPRDLSFNGSTKINEAIAFGGENAVKRVSEGLDIEIHDFVLINLAGFRKIIDSVDGVPVFFPHPARDIDSFFSVPAGCRILSGTDALNYVRSRKYEQLINGTWQSDARTDYNRADRQRDFLILAMDRAIAKGGRNPTTMRNLLNTTVDSKSMVLDDRLTPGDLLDLGQAFGNYEPEALQRYALPTYGIGESRLGVDEARAGPVLDIFRGNVPDLQPFQVPVRVIDARPQITEPSPAKQLAEAKFVSGTARTSPSGPAELTTIRFTSDERYAAILLARYLVTTPAFEQVPGSKATKATGETLQLTVGADWDGVRAQPRGDDDTALLSRLADAAATGRATAVPTTASAAATVATSGAAPAAAVEPAAGGIIGRPPDGVACTRS
jgi:polyisoprenyl-teichoic acid--peptidoglycan teichoic acid transferase